MKLKKYRIVILVILALVLAADVFMQFLPLTKYFSYEYAAVNAIIIFFLFGIAVIQFLKNFKGRDLDIFKNEKIYQLAFLFILVPLTVSAFASAFRGGCPFFAGMPFYAAVTVPALIPSFVLAFLSVQFSPRYSYLLFLLFAAAVLVVPLSVVFFYPQIYFYHPVTGFFPGVIYDVKIEVSAELVWYRIYNLIGYSILFIAAVKVLNDKKVIYRVFFYIFLLLVLSFSLLLDEALGFITTREDIKRELTEERVTEHTVIHIPPGTGETEARYIELSAEYYYDELEAFFDYGTDEKVTIWLFENNEQKKRLFGSENADVAKWFSHEIYSDMHSYEHTLKHEMAHIFSGKIGNNIIITNIPAGINPALIEGIAVASSPVQGDYPVTHLAALAAEYDYDIPVSKLYSGLNFFGNVSTLSYIYSGAFYKYLIDKYGIEKGKEFYAEGDIEDVFGISTDSINTAFKTYLKDYVHGASKQRADFYFGRKALINMLCPRYVAAQIDEIKEQIKHNNYRKALEGLLFLKDYSDSFGITRLTAVCYSRLNEYEKAAATLTKDSAGYRGTADYYALLNTLGSIYMKTGRLEEAANIFRKLESYNITFGYSLTAALKQRLLSDSLTANEYISGSNMDRYKIVSRLNRDTLFYPAVTAMLDLSIALNESYELFMRQFDGRFEGGGIYADYAALKLAAYALSNLDIVRAEFYLKYALASDNFAVKENALLLKDKINWFKEAID